MEATRKEVQSIKDAPEPVKCSYQSANIYMSTTIATKEKPAFAKLQRIGVLPSAVGTLYDLSRLPDQGLAAADAEGWVSPQTQRRDGSKIAASIGSVDEGERRATDRRRTGDQ